jgi:predicted flap endonuclease-1-like 5' DNA nuclease
MFQEWGFLLGEIWILLALAALLGLFAGWIIWGGKSQVNVHDLQAKLDTCQAKLKECENRPVPKAAAPVAVAPVVAATPVVSEDYDGDGILEGANEGVRPEALQGPRGGKADDLKQIKGIGLKMEKLCNSLGFYHFDQIAGWNTQEVAWVDANLEGFKGRVTRDEWVKQAKILAAGGTTEFAKKVSKGDVSY